MQYQKKELKNKIQLVTIPIQNVKSATVLILINTGSRYENSENNGVAHFIEHMMFKGTQKRPTPVHISEEIDSLGADFNAFTSKEYTGYYIKSAADYVGKTIEILADMLINSTFNQEEIEKEKGVIIEEINMYSDTPMRQIGNIYEELVYNGHPLSFDTAGTKSSVASLTREKILEYKQEHYTGENIVVVVAGKINQGEIEQMVESNFSQIADIPKSNQLLRYKDAQKSPMIKVTYKQTDQAHFCIGMRSFEIGNPQRYAMSIFNTIIGGNMSSKLFVELREKRGLCYYISSDNDTYLDTGTWVIQAGVDIERYDKALIAVLELLNQIKSNGFTTEEIQNAKKYLKGRMALGLEDSKGIANLYGINLLLENNIRTPEEIISEIENVNIKQINNLAKSIIIKQKISYAIIGPFEEEHNKVVDSIIQEARI